MTLCDSSPISLVERDRTNQQNSGSSTGVESEAQAPETELGQQESFGEKCLFFLFLSFNFGGDSGITVSALGRTVRFQDGFESCIQVFE